MTETVMETGALNSLPLFTCTTVRYGQMLQEGFGILGEMSEYMQSLQCQDRRKFIQEPRGTLLSPSGLLGNTAYYFFTLILQMKINTCFEITVSHFEILHIYFEECCVGVQKPV